MHMIPDTSPPAQPTELWRVDVIVGETRIDSAYFSATDDEVDMVALGIVVAQGGDSGDVHQYSDGTNGIYYSTVVVK
ncbi:hypothetical protein MED01_004293 [Micromonospora sp. MED01]|uniref:hypothetical protein n=1 Tax=Micromonospora alfalfae TaxID=2911212 RepID=UPI001EE97C44|nr:hypothetical protein [Micromonospora alfalfae]MCG5460867.1 hypothetical protein [Micromonospora alfalfae]